MSGSEYKEKMFCVGQIFEEDVRKPKNERYPRFAKRN